MPFYSFAWHLCTIHSLWAHVYCAKTGKMYKQTTKSLPVFHFFYFSKSEWNFVSVEVRVRAHSFFVCIFLDFYRPGQLANYFMLIFVMQLCSKGIHYFTCYCHICSFTSRVFYIFTIICYAHLQFLRQFIHIPYLTICYSIPTYIFILHAYLFPPPLNQMWNLYTYIYLFCLRV